MNLHELGIADAAQAIRDKRISATELAQDCLARIKQREAEVGAWQFVDPDSVLEQARKLDAQPGQGPLHGVPIGVKDIINTADMPTEYGSPIYRAHRPRMDAAPVALLRRAGALIVGKTVTTEFAFFSSRERHATRAIPSIRRAGHPADRLRQWPTAWSLARLVRRRPAR
ncbi:amidase family protein [Undibacterium arcticum]